MTQRILVLCPLEIERRAAAGRVGAMCEVRRIGPGADNVMRAMETINLREYSLVVLFGVAGGLTQTDRAPAIAEVVDRESGERWKSPTVDDGIGVTVVGVDAPVYSPQTKRELHAGFDASLVDCESHEFARRCEAAGVLWAIVRGVSDGPTTTLPVQSAGWISRDGRTRLRGVTQSFARNPLIIGSLLKLGRQTNLALKAACDRLATVVAQDVQRVQQ